jgi:hypothetical protein
MRRSGDAGWFAIAGRAAMGFVDRGFYEQQRAEALATGPNSIVRCNRPTSRHPYVEFTQRNVAFVTVTFPYASSRWLRQTPQIQWSPPSAIGWQTHCFATVRPAGVAGTLRGPVR